METYRQIIARLSRLRSTKTLVIGIGNVLKGDDAAGPAVCERLRGKISAEVIDTGTVPENYIQPIIKKAPDNLLIIDAIDFAAPPGELRIFQPEQLDSLVISTHTLSPRIFVDMIKRSVDVEVFFLGIQPAKIVLGQPLSAEVDDAIELLVKSLVEVFAPAK